MIMLRILAIFFSLLVGVTCFAQEELIPILDNERSFAFRLQTLRALKSGDTVRISAFEVDPNAETYAFLMELKLASKRGVKVKLNIDAFGSRLIKPHILDYVQRSGVEITLFNVFTPYRFLHYFRHRMHDKVFSIESKVHGKFAIIGDRNIGWHYFGSEGSERFMSFETVAFGKIVKRINRYFDEKLADKRNEPRNINRVIPKESPEIELDRLAKGATSYERLTANSEVFDEIKLQRKNKVAIDSKEIEFLSDRINEDYSRKHARRYFEILGKAQSSVTFITPFLVLTPEMKELFLELNRRGVKLRVITSNGPTNSVKTAHDGYLVYSLSWLQRHNIEIRETNVPLHAKITLMDAGTPNARTVFGSFNLDYRSQYLNSETALYIRNAKFTDQVEKMLVPFEQTTTPAPKLKVWQRSPCTSISRLFAWTIGPYL